MNPGMESRDDHRERIDLDEGSIPRVAVGTTAQSQTSTCISAVVAILARMLATAIIDLTSRRIVLRVASGLFSC